MGATAREDFVPAQHAATAYMDRAVPLGEGRMLSPPLATGLMLDAANIQPDDNILLIGAATGYMARLIAGRGATVTAVEQSATMLALARQKLSGVAGVILVDAPLNLGAPSHGPYTLIIIDGAIAQIPREISAQLAEGGRVVTGVIEGSVSRLAMGYKHGDGIVLCAIADTEIAALPGFERANEFVF